MARDAINLRVDSDLKENILRAATAAGMNLTDYIAEALSCFTRQPYEPWAHQMCMTSGSRVIIKGGDIFDYDSRLLLQACDEARLLEKATGAVTDERVVLRQTVPRCLSMAEISLGKFVSWWGLRSDYLAAISRYPRLQVNRLHIYDTLSDRIENDLCEDRMFEELALIALGNGNADNVEPRRVNFRYAAVSDILGSHGHRADREYLNDFNVYGSFAVSFTVGTSYGVTNTGIKSELKPDIDYWTRKFDNIFPIGMPYRKFTERHLRKHPYVINRKYEKFKTSMVFDDFKALFKMSFDGDFKALFKMSFDDFKRL